MRSNLHSLSEAIVEAPETAVSSRADELADWWETTAAEETVLSAITADNSLASTIKAIKESGGGSYIAYYEAKPEELTFYLLDAEKVRALIKGGKLKGNPGEKQYDIAELTGSPQEVAAFLGSKDGLASRVDGPGGRMRRVH